MNQFVLAFPLPVAKEESFPLTETLSIAADAKTLLVPGCNVQFSVVRKEAAAGLSEIFNDHQEISAEDAAAIDAHKSLLFLLGEVKSIEDVRQVDLAILKIFTAGATGVYMQQSGAAWTSEGFREVMADGEFPMDMWLNFLEGEDVLYSLGMATFGLPDLCISRTVENPQEALMLAADALFGDGIPAKSGSEVDVGDGEVYVLRAEAKNPFPKDSPEFNKQGIFRLNKKK